MKLILKIIILFSLATLVAILCSYGPGHVIILINKYRLDLSFTTLVLIILLAYGVLHYLFLLCGSIYHIPSGIRHYRQKMSLIRSRNYFSIAAINYFRNEYKVAYTEALRSISQDTTAYNKFPVVLLAIDAIHLMNEDDEKSLAKLSKVVSKLRSHDERNYVYAQLLKINKTKNDRFYTEILNNLSV